MADVKIVDPAKAALDSMNENVKLIGTINTALFGTCGALAVKGSEWSGVRGGVILKRFVS